MSFEISVRKRLGDRDIVLDLDAGDGATILFGPSGAGKTSVLNMVAGLLRPDAGTIRVAGATLFDAGAIDVAPERRGSCPHRA
jgi:molybdate transport system ATP-binding protein